jgi:hypothetical protein
VLFHPDATFHIVSEEADAVAYWQVFNGIDQ